MSQQDTDNTVFIGLNGDHAASDLPSSIRAVTASGSTTPKRNMLYIAQQTSLEQYTPGLNPLVNAAVPLLLTIVRLREEGTVPFGKDLVTQGGLRPHTQEEVAPMDVESLRIRLEAEIRGFEAQALASDLDKSQVLAARYLLCTAVDEAVSASAFGEGGEWAKLALLSTFHDETWGGEKFFLILDRCMQQPARNLYVLELMYLLLSLGFEGKYHVLDRGALEIESLRDKIYRQVRLLRGEPAQDLSKKVEAVPGSNKTYAYMPLWLLGLIVVICLVVTFIGFSWTLGSHADPLLQKLEKLQTSRIPNPMPQEIQLETGPPISASKIPQGPSSAANKPPLSIHESEAQGGRA